MATSQYTKDRNAHFLLRLKERKGIELTPQQLGNLKKPELFHGLAKINTSNSIGIVVINKEKVLVLKNKFNNVFISVLADNVGKDVTATVNAIYSKKASATYQQRMIDKVNAITADVSLATIQGTKKETALHYSGHPYFNIIMNNLFGVGDKKNYFLFDVIRRAEKLLHQEDTDIPAIKVNRNSVKGKAKINENTMRAIGFSMVSNDTESNTQVYRIEPNGDNCGFELVKKKLEHTDPQRGVLSAIIHYENGEEKLFKIGFAIDSIKSVRKSISDFCGGED